MPLPIWCSCWSCCLLGLLLSLVAVTALSMLLQVLFANAVLSCHCFLCHCTADATVVAPCCSCHHHHCCQFVVASFLLIFYFAVAAAAANAAANTCSCCCHFWFSLQCNVANITAIVGLHCDWLIVASLLLIFGLLLQSLHPCQCCCHCTCHCHQCHLCCTLCHVLPMLLLIIYTNTNHIKNILYKISIFPITTKYSYYNMVFGHVLCLKCIFCIIVLMVWIYNKNV